MTVDDQPSLPFETRRAARPALATEAERNGQVLAALAVRPMTAEEVAAHYGVERQTFRPRCTTLHKGKKMPDGSRVGVGKIIAVGKRASSTTGKPAVVYALPDVAFPGLGESRA